MKFEKVCQQVEDFEKKVIDSAPESTARKLMPSEGDNVDKVSDVVTHIKKHLDAIVPMVNNQEMISAEKAALAIEGLAQSLQFLIREMDPENG